MFEGISIDIRHNIGVQISVQLHVGIGVVVGVGIVIGVGTGTVAAVIAIKVVRKERLFGILHAKGRIHVG
jgi:hypothetical protein